MGVRERWSMKWSKRLLEINKITLQQAHNLFNHDRLDCDGYHLGGS